MKKRSIEREKSFTPADGITLCRAVLTAVLCFLPFPSRAFTASYLAAGATDALDGAVARRVCGATKHGALLDSIADLFFFAVCLGRIWCAYSFSLGIRIGVGAVVLLRGVNALYARLRYGRWLFLHTALNKTVGTFLFLYPMTLKFADAAVGALVLCVAAGIASIDEGIRLLRGKT